MIVYRTRMTKSIKSKPNKSNVWTNEHEYFYNFIIWRSISFQSVFRTFILYTWFNGCFAFNDVANVVICCFAIIYFELRMKQAMNLWIYLYIYTRYELGIRE